VGSVVGKAVGKAVGATIGSEVGKAVGRSVEGGPVSTNNTFTAIEGWALGATEGKTVAVQLLHVLGQY
jgi:hypothetical protein